MGLAYPKLSDEDMADLREAKKMLENESDGH
jgi:hypothetical protein